MKITFQDQHQMAQEITGFSDVVSLVKFKRDINRGGTMFLSVLSREYNRKFRYTDLVAVQQYYQLPEDGHKLKEAAAIIGSSSSGLKVPLEQVPDETRWRWMNQSAITGNPSHYFIRGYDEVGLWPIPAADIEDGFELAFGPKHISLTEDDYDEGSVTVTNGDDTITGSGTTWTSKMVGQWIEVTDGTDGNWYRVSEFGSATSLTIENYYQGTSGPGKDYRIGPVMDMPEEYLEAPVDWAMYRHFLKRGDSQKANEFKALYEEAQRMAKDQYGQITDNAIVAAEPSVRPWSPFLGDSPNVPLS